MIFYLSSPNNQLQAAAVNDCPVLLSFAIAGGSRWQMEYLPSYSRVLLDSGAYTEYNTGKPVDGPRYVDWVSEIPCADAYAGIDDIRGDWRLSLRNYEDFGGFPTIHDSDPPGLLDDLIPMARERGGWIGVGLTKPRHGKEKWVGEILGRMPDDLHVHGWALGMYLQFPRLDSVDSTNWWRDGMKLRTMSMTAHLTYAECLEIVVKRYRRQKRLTVSSKQVQEELWVSN